MAEVNKKLSGGDVAYCRAEMAELLTKALETTRKIEDRLNFSGGWREAKSEIDFDVDPIAALRFEGALLLRKARIHSLAVLRANEASNLHSLAVQMRPVLECIGQVVFKFKNAVIAPDVLLLPEKAVETLGQRLNADFYQTFRRRTKGQISREELFEMATRARSNAADLFGGAVPKRQKSWSLNHSDKVDTLPNGCDWYNYLSNHFTHCNLADWKGLSCRGGVMSFKKIEDEFTFLVLMRYLVNHVALMNAAAALCPVSGDEEDLWGRWVEPTLAQLCEVRQSSKSLADAAVAVMIGESDGSTGLG